MNVRVIVIPLSIAHRHENLLEPTLWIYAALIAGVSCALSYTLELVAMARVSPRVFGVLMILEPAIATLFGHFLRGEALYPEQWGGIATTMIASLGSIASVPLSAREGLNAMPQATIV